MTKNKIVLIGLTSILAAGIAVGFKGTKTMLTKIKAEECKHENVQHYEEDEEHAEHWACCECHNAWSDSSLTNAIGNTILDRSQIDVPRSYSYNNSTGKIEYGRNGVVAGTITPNGVVSNMKFHANNSNVMQFEAGSNLETYVTQDLKVLNPECVLDTFGLSKSSKSTLVYWSDSHTFGFQQGGAFTTFNLGTYIEAENMVLTDGSNYYVIELMGAVFAERHGVMKTVVGYFEDSIINNLSNNGNYYADIKANIKTDFWTCGGDDVGTDWTYSGGTCYLVNKISGGVTSEFGHVTGETANGTFPGYIKEATLHVKNQNPQFLRLGANGSQLAAGDRLVLKAGSIFTDDANGNDAVLVKEDIALDFNGSALVEPARTYSYNEESGKIEVRKLGVLKEQITPDGYVPSLKFHANNGNVMQFKAQGSLENYATQNLTIMNPENIIDTFGLDASNKSTLVYWNDSHTFGFQQGGAFTAFNLGKFIEGENLVLTDGSHYYVLGLIGAAFSERIGIMTTVSGFFKNNIINTFEHNGNYYADIEVKVERTFWTGGDTIGTDWAYNGGTSYLINKISGGETVEFTHVTNSNPQNGTFPAGIKEATVYAGGQAKQFVRMGFDGSLLSAGDQLVIVAGSMLSDDGNGVDTVIVKNNIVLTFDGTGFTL